MFTLSDLYFYKKIMHKYQKGKWNRFVFPLIIFYKNTGHTFLQRIKLDALFKFYLNNLHIFSSSSVKQVKFLSMLKNLVSQFIKMAAYPTDILRSKATFLSRSTQIPVNKNILYLSALLRIELQKNFTNLKQPKFLDFVNATQLIGTGSGVRMPSMPVSRVHDFEQMTLKTNSTALINTLIDKNRVVKTEKHYAPYNQERKSLIRFFRMRKIIQSDVVFKKLKYKYLQKIGYVFKKPMDSILRKPSMRVETVIENLHREINQSVFHSKNIDFNHLNDARTKKSSSDNVFRKPMDLILRKPLVHVGTVIEDVKLHKEINQSIFHSKSVDFNHLDDVRTKKSSSHNVFRKPMDLILRKPSMHVETVIENVKHKEKILSDAAGNLNTGISPEKKLDEINVIADKVYKLFEKRLLIEKERRGAHIIG